MSGRAVSVAVDAEAVAAGLEAHEDYRVVRRVREMRRSETPGVRHDMVAAVVVDVETTGLDIDADPIVELALTRIWADANGRVRLTGRSRTWFEDPGRPLSPEIRRLTGLSDEMLAGRSILDPEAGSLIRDADVVIAHNAGFDRPRIERRLPFCAGRPWICSLRDVDWRGLGFEGGRLGDLLLQAGWFYSAHRAKGDVDALIRLLDHDVGDGTTVLRHALDRASRPTARIVADGSPFEARIPLRARGYRWNAERKAWEREVDLDARPDEVEWVRRSIYAGRRDPSVEPVCWRTRHGAR